MNPITDIPVDEVLDALLPALEGGDDAALESALCRWQRALPYVGEVLARERPMTARVIEACFHCADLRRVLRFAEAVMRGESRDRLLCRLTWRCVEAPRGRAGAHAVRTLGGLLRADPSLARRPRGAPGFTVAHHCAWLGREDLLASIASAAPEMAIETDGFGESPLSVALYRGNGRCASVLLSAFPAAAGRAVAHPASSRAPLPVACAAAASGCCDPLSWLARSEPTILWRRGPEGMLPVHFAAAYGQGRALATLMAHGMGHDQLDARGRDAEAHARAGRAAGAREARLCAEAGGCAARLRDGLPAGDIERGPVSLVSL